MTAVSTEAQQVADLLRGADCAVVLTGAGISVPSGIPDFRSPGTGLWENVDPMEVAHIDAWRRDPDRFWSFYGQRFASLTDKQPNDAHLALAELERRGLIRAVITQNIDRLHRLAGTERLIEVHGSIDRSVCMECGGKVSIDRVVELLAAGDGAPLCEACVAPLKPDVVLFGELLGGREEVLPAEELVLRARADLNAGRLAEAALQARVAIESLLASKVAAPDSGAAGASLADHREAIAGAANAALSGDLPGDAAAALEEAVAAMEQALKRRRLGG